jgi:cytosine/adenosine deaminase-related metal-dependent hydrolase
LIPEIRAQERMEEAMVAVLPHVSRSAQREILRAWKILARQEGQPVSEATRDQAWNALRSVVRGR